jgi:5-methylcytosine-specific restriction endonuclease McrA
VNAGYGKFPTDTHHIHPLGLGGPDVIENMVVVCGNCHDMFTNHALIINLKKQEVYHVDNTHEYHQLNTDIDRGEDEGKLLDHAPYPLSSKLFIDFS